VAALIILGPTVVVSPRSALQCDQVAALLAPGLDAAVYGGDVLAGLVPKAPSLQRTVANVGRLILMALCGVSFPRAYSCGPQWSQPADTWSVEPWYVNSLP
jgi:hypothetical protein